MAVTDYSTTPASNTTISGINIAEGWSPANVNNAFRQLMADIATADFAGKADPTFTTKITSPRIVLTATGNGSLASADNAIQIGSSSGANAIFDQNEWQVRNNGAAATAVINKSGGDVQLASSGSTTIILGDVTIAEDLAVTGHVRSGAGTGQTDTGLQLGAADVGFYDTGTNMRATHSGTYVAHFDSPGTTLSETRSVVTREKGDGRYSQIGMGQTWQDVNSSRAINTAYQNTEGTPIEVCIGASVTATGSTYQVSSDQITWITLGVVGEETTPVSFVVPDDWYYRINRTGGGVFSLNYWSELR